LLAGSILHCINWHENHLYFIAAGLVTRYGVMKDGTSTEFAVTGCEGVIGIASFLGGVSTPFCAEALSAGFAYRLGGDLVTREFALNSPLAQLLLRYVQALMLDIGQTAACNRHHSLEKRLCRWLLSSLDRLLSNELTVTHEVISNVLGVRRESITQAVGSLENAGLIHHTRGRIILLDRPRLKALACECYSVVKQEYARLLPETRQAELVV
jgi:CRP-like cAMP-binding protein